MYVQSYDKRTEPKVYVVGYDQGQMILHIICCRYVCTERWIFSVGKTLNMVYKAEMIDSSSRKIGCTEERRVWEMIFPCLLDRLGDDEDFTVVPGSLGGETKVLLKVRFPFLRLAGGRTRLL